LASGDPGFFGIVRVLAEQLGSARLEIHPAPSSVALAFARSGLSWDDATVVSAHGRSLEEAAARAGGAKVAVLTSPDNPPQALGQALQGRGCAARAVTVVSALGEPGEAIVRTDLEGLAAGRFDPLSVVLLVAPEAPSEMGLAFGLPESSFEHRDGMITKAEVRAVVLGKLALPPAGVLWDVGAGSGSVGIEAARLRPGLRVIALERSGADADRIRANARSHGVPVEVVVGDAPAAFEGLPDPDRVFLGGGGLEVLDAALARLPPDGLLVATFALVDRAAAAWRRLGEMAQVSVSRAVPVAGEGPRLASENPVFVCWGRRGGHVLSSTAHQARSPGLRGKGS
jgi:precorrin-6Y C5,15-methyltransferase (decarboxylating)